MIGYVDVQHTTVDDKEQLTSDDTVGLLTAVDDEVFRAGAKFDVGRLRRALLAFEEEYGHDDVHIGISKIQIEGRDGGIAVLTLQESENAHRAVALACKVDPEGGDA